MSAYITVDWKCPNCDQITEVKVWPYIPPRTHGHPDSWCDAEGGESEPENCEHCNEEIPNAKVHEMIEEES